MDNGRIQNLRFLSLKLEVSGTAQVVNNTKLYRGGFGFVQLQAFVPVTQQAGGRPLLTVFRTTIDNAGNRIQHQNDLFGLLFVQNVTLDGAEYMLFETPLPEPFTRISGDLEFVFNYSELNDAGRVVARMPTNIFATIVSDGGVPETALDIDVPSQALSQINQNTSRINTMWPMVWGAQNALENIEPRLEVVENWQQDIEPRIAGAENAIDNIKPRLSNVEGLANLTQGTLADHLTDGNAHANIQAQLRSELAAHNVNLAAHQNVQAHLLQLANEYTDHQLANAEQPKRWLGVLEATTDLPQGATFGGRQGDTFDIVSTDDISGRTDIDIIGVYTEGMPAFATFDADAGRWVVVLTYQRVADGDTITYRDPDGALQVAKIPNSLQITVGTYGTFNFDGSSPVSVDINPLTVGAATAAQGAIAEQALQTAEDAIHDPNGEIETLEVIEYSDLMNMSDAAAEGRTFLVNNDPIDDMALMGSSAENTSQLAVQDPATESIDGLAQSQQGVNQQFVSEFAGIADAITTLVKIPTVSVYNKPFTNITFNGEINLMVVEITPDLSLISFWGYAQQIASGTAGQDFHIMDVSEYPIFERFVGQVDQFAIGYNAATNDFKYVPLRITNTGIDIVTAPNISVGTRFSFQFVLFLADTTGGNP